MEQGGRTRGRYAKTAERRAAVARAALDIVLEKGHRALTTAEVASRAGMGETTLLYHFPSRDHVLVAAMELSDEDFRTRARAELLAAGLLDEDWGLGPARLALGQDRTARLLLALEAEAPDPEHPAHEYLKRRNDGAVRRLAERVRLRQREGRALPGLNPLGTARQILAAWTGLRAQWLIDPSFDFPQEVAQAYRALTGEAAMEAKNKIQDLITTV